MTNPKCPLKKGMRSPGTGSALTEDCPGRVWALGLPYRGEYACDTCETEFYGETAKKAIEDWRLGDKESQWRAAEEITAEGPSEKLSYGEGDHDYGDGDAS